MGGGYGETRRYDAYGGEQGGEADVQPSALIRGGYYANPLGSFGLPILDFFLKACV